MGAIWLLSMPEVLLAAGLYVDVYPGWQTRSRSSGGYDSLLGVQLHHTASNTSPINDMKYMWENAPTKPIGAIYLSRTGKVTVGAAGATNTSGKGGPLGSIPLDRANQSVIAIEAANSGTGEVWPVEQQRAYTILVNALVKAYGLNFTVPGVHSHFEWAPNRKNDPAGESRWATGKNKWDMNKFRLDASGIAPTPPPPEPPKPPKPQGVKDMFFAINPTRNSDSRAFGGLGIPAADRMFGLNTSVIPANAVAVALNYIVINPLSDGYLTVWPNGARPSTSCLNFKSGPGATSGSIIVGTNGQGGFMVYNSATAHMVFDVTGYWTP